MVVKCTNHSFYVPLRKENAQDGEPIIWHTESMQRNKLYIQKEIAKKPAHSTLAPDGGGENLLKFLTTSQYSVVVSGLYDIILYDYMI